MRYMQKEGFKDIIVKGDDIITIQVLNGNVRFESTQHKTTRGG